MTRTLSASVCASRPGESDNQMMCRAAAQSAKVNRGRSGKEEVAEAGCRREKHDRLGSLCRNRKGRALPLGEPQENNQRRQESGDALRLRLKVGNVQRPKGEKHILASHALLPLRGGHEEGVEHADPARQHRDLQPVLVLYVGMFESKVGTLEDAATGPIRAVPSVLGHCMECMITTEE